MIRNSLDSSPNQNIGYNSMRNYVIEIDHVPGKDSFDALTQLHCHFNTLHCKEKKIILPCIYNFFIQMVCHSVMTE